MILYLCSARGLVSHLKRQATFASASFMSFMEIFSLLGLLNLRRCDLFKRSHNKTKANLLITSCWLGTMCPASIRSQNPPLILSVEVPKSNKPKKSNSRGPERNSWNLPLHLCVHRIPRIPNDVQHRQREVTPNTEEKLKRRREIFLATN